MPTETINDNSLWLIQKSEYDDLFGQEFDFIRGGSLTIQDNSNAVNLDYIWVSRRTRASGNLPGVDDPPELEHYEDIFTQSPSTISWWQIRSQSSGNSGRDDLLPADGLPLAEGELYYLGIDGNVAINPFIRASSLRLNSDNPSFDDRVFDLLIRDNYQVSQVIVEHVRTPDNPAQVSVPEASPVLGLLLFGVVGISLLIKRQFARNEWG